MDGTLTKKTVSEGATVQFPTNPSKVGHAFLGWYTSEGAEVSSPYVPTGDVTLYAKFEEIPQETSVPWNESTTPWAENQTIWEES